MSEVPSAESDAPAVEVWDASVPPGGYVCSLCGWPTESEPCEHLTPVAAYNVTRFACHCGRFLAESAIRETNHRDDSRYYGIRTEVEWDCGRCGTVKGEEWEPQLVLIDTRPIPPVETRAESDPHATNGRVSTAQNADSDGAGA